MTPRTGTDPTWPTRVATWAVRHRAWVLALAVLCVIAGCWSAYGLQDRLDLGGATPGNSESARAERWLSANSAAGQAHLVLVAETAVRGGVAAVEADGAALTRYAAHRPGVLGATSWWTSHDPSLRSRNGEAALVALRLRGDETHRVRSAAELIGDLDSTFRSLRVTVTGPAAAGAETMEQVGRDAELAEVFSVPVVMVLLVLAFGSLTGGLLPIAVGLIAVTGTLGVLRVLTLFTEISVLTVNFTTALGFGLAVDYSLFLVTRYREERQCGSSAEEALTQGARTAGHTVMFSAATIALCATGLFLFPLYFLQSMAAACISIVVIAAAASMTVLPVLLTLVGDHVVGRPRCTAQSRPRFWGHLARAIQRSPALWGLPALGLLVLLALPAPLVQFQLADDQALSPRSSVHATTEYMRRTFGAGALEPMTVVLPNIAPATEHEGLDSYARCLSRLPYAGAVRSATGLYRQGKAVPTHERKQALASPAGTWLEVAPSAGITPYSTEAKELVSTVRRVPAPTPGRMVGGTSAVLTDTELALADRLPAATAVVVLSIALLMFRYTRSVLVPVKAIAVSALSVASVAGIMVAVFQQGRLHWLVGPFNTHGRLEISTPLLVLFLSFALSMDYEMFLISRIMEAYRRSGDAADAVREGLERTGRLITLAASTLIFTIALLTTSPMTVVKLFGFSLAAALTTDAVVVRSILVPAVMHLAGTYTWWGPRKGWWRGATTR